MRPNPPLSPPIVIHKILPIALPLLNQPLTYDAAPLETHLQEDTESWAQHSHSKWKPREVTIGMEYVLNRHSQYSNPFCNSSLQIVFIMLENGSFNVFNLARKWRPAHYDLCSYICWYLMFSFCMCLKGAMFVFSGLVSLWQCVHVLVVLAWDCIRTCILVFGFFKK